MKQESKSVQIPFGIRNNKIVHIADADRGLDCNCYCLECGGKLSARKGEVIQHYFAHYNQVDHYSCSGGVETALHKYAKQVIEAAGYLILPAFKVSLPYPDEAIYAEIPSRKAVFDRIVIEEQMHFGRRRVDVVGYEGEERLLIEIFVTHRVKGKKLEDVRVAKEAMIEVEIQQKTLFPDGVLNTKGLEYLILDSVKNKRWIFHPRAAELEASLKKPQINQFGQFPVDHRQHVGKVKRPVKQVSPERRGGLPARNEYSPEEYVIKLYEFLSSSYKDNQIRAQVISQLRLDDYYITNNDDEIAKKYGLYF